MCHTTCVFVLQLFAAGLIELGRRRGERVSGVLFIYWLIHVISAIIILRSKINRAVVEVGLSLLL